MLQSLLTGSISTFDLITILLRIPCILIALTVHEISHGYAAYKLGDPTAKALGRLDLNPIRHLDHFGTLCLLLFGFGWAKPVPINPLHFKRMKRDTAITAAAGPLSNFLLGFICALLSRLVAALSDSSFLLSLFRVSTLTDVAFTDILFLFFYIFSLLNFGLALFNLIPIPPLDGSRILFAFLPTNAYFAVMKYERFIMIGMLVLLWSGLVDVPLSGAINFLYSLGYNVFYLFPAL